MVAYLISSGQSPNSLDSSNMTPLMWSAFKVQNVNPLSVLLKLGVSLFNPSLFLALVNSNFIHFMF